MEKHDLLVSLTIDHNFPGKASYCITYFFLSGSTKCRSIQDDHVILGNDGKGKGKGKTRAKGLKAENVPLKKETSTNRRTNQEPLSLSARFFFLA